MKPRVTAMGRSLLICVLAAAAGPAATLRAAAAAPAAPTASCSWSAVADAPSVAPNRGLSLSWNDYDDMWAVARASGAPSTSSTEHWDGRQWIAVPSANPTDDLGAVAVRSRDDVWAVGHGIEHWDGHRWTSVPHPPISRYLAVSALGGTPWAAGDYGIAQWDGSQWVAQSLPSIAGSNPVIYSIQDTGADVYAVGKVDVPAGAGVVPQSLVLRYHGGAWVRTPSPNPGTAGNTLYSVDTDANGELRALGDGSDTGLLSLLWDGSQWNREVTGMPAVRNAHVTQTYWPIAGAPSGDGKEFWVGGAAPATGTAVLVHHDSSGWYEESVPFAAAITGMGGRVPDSVFAATAPSGSQPGVVYQRTCSTTTAAIQPVAAVTGTDGQLYARPDRGAWQRYGGNLLGAPAASRIPQSRRHYFVAVGTDRQVWIRSEAWGWQPLGGGDQCSSSPSIYIAGSRTFGGNVYVACRGMDGAVWYTTPSLPSDETLPVASSWQSLGGSIVDGPALGIYSAGYEGGPFVFANGTDGHVWGRGITFSGWKQEPWQCQGQPATWPTPYITFVACRGSDNTLQLARVPYDQSDNPPQMISYGGGLLGGVGIFGTSADSTVYVEGTDRALYENTVVGDHANGWINDGGALVGGAAAG